MSLPARPEPQIPPASNPLSGRPVEGHPDSFQSNPDPSPYEERHADFISHVLKNTSPSNIKSIWYELIRVVGGGQAQEDTILDALRFIDARQDCADFVLHGILRMLYQFSSETGGKGSESDHPFSSSLLAAAKRTTLNFKYFPNEPGIDSLCTWTENHYILYTSAAYLAGQLYPNETFTNSGETGLQKIESNRKRILRWLDLRFRSGFSEWLSHVYYDEDLTALLSLFDFAKDEEIRRKAEAIIHLLLLDMALNTFKGVFGSTHGRSYEKAKKWAFNEGTIDTMKLLFGLGVYSAFDNMSACAFALSSFRVPPAIEAIARDITSTFENRQRMGIKLDEMERWGLHPDNFEDGMHYLTLEAYLTPRTIVNTLSMFDTCNWWENSFLSAFKPYRGLLKTVKAFGGLPLLARFLQRDACRNTREEVNIYTYKTPDYMLSTAQDYRKGYGGDQQHIWQATLGEDAVCFTTHPARIEGATPNYWEGSGLLPRAAQYKNVLIAIYNIQKIPAVYVPIKHFFTHAWLPKDKFDEIIEKNNWIFARKGDGYLALRSQNPYRWATYRTENGDSKGFQKPIESDTELIVEGAQNIWICQMGRKVEDGTFEHFIDSVSSAGISFDKLNVQYQSPGNGRIEFGWKTPLTADGVAIQLHDYPRYDNPFVKAEFDPQVIRVTAGNHTLAINWASSSSISSTL